VSGEVPSAPENSPARPGELPVPAGDPPAVPGQFAIGSQIAGYRLMEQIGRGGMAVVYRAMDLRLDRPVALKILAPELARDEAFRHRFIRECRAAAAVDHPCIIPVFDAGEASGVLFIAMRYVSGRDVRTLLDREGSLPADRVVNIIEQVASALDAAHARGLVHRDVKPANMLLDSAASSGHLDHVYLADFGLTKQSQLTSSLTSTGQFLGTLDYIAPEQIEGSKLVDGRADLYSLACAAFEMLSGAPPFRRDQGVAVIWAQISAPPPRLTDLRPDLPAAVDRVLAKALAKAPSDRHETCLEFAAALSGGCELAADPAAPGAGSHRPATQPARWAGMADGWPDRSAAAAFAEEPPTRASSLSPARRTSPDPSYPAADAPSGQRYPPPGQPYAPPGQPYAPPGQPRAGQPYRRGPSRRRPWWRSPAALIVGCLAVLCLAAGAIAVLRSGASRSSAAPLTSASSALRTGGPTGSAGTATHVARSPSGTLRAYFAALNDHDYVKAWDLGGRYTGSAYTGYVNGFGATAKDTVTIVSVSGSVVTARITAVQTDGTVKTYQGTYTVNKGVITQFNVQQTG
jgi:serine/threonine protein kinase